MPSYLRAAQVARVAAALLPLLLFGSGIGCQRRGASGSKEPVKDPKTPTPPVEPQQARTIRALVDRLKGPALDGPLVVTLPRRRWRRPPPGRVAPKETAPPGSAPAPTPTSKPTPTLDDIGAPALSFLWAAVDDKRMIARAAPILARLVLRHRPGEARRLLTHDRPVVRGVGLRSISRVLPKLQQERFTRLAAHVIPELIRLLDDEAVFELRVFPGGRDRTGMPLRGHKRPVTVSSAALQTLRRLSFINLGKDGAAWLAWWRLVRARDRDQWAIHALVSGKGANHRIQGRFMNHQLSPEITAGLIRAMRSPHVEARKVGSVVIGKRGNTGAIEPLRRCLRDSNQDVRMYAAISLGRIGDRSVTKDLVPLLGDREVRVAQYAALGLGLLKDPSAVPALVGRLAKTKGATDYNERHLGDDIIKSLRQITGHAFRYKPHTGSVAENNKRDQIIEKWKARSVKR